MMQNLTILTKQLLILFMIGASIPVRAQAFRGDTSPKLFTLIDPSASNVFFNNRLVDKEEHSILLYSNYYGGGGVGICDINNDGLQDLFFTGNLVGDRLYLNQGNLVFRDITESAGIIDNGGWSSGVAFGDVNGDGFQDIYVTRELYDDHPELWANQLYINNGDHTFTESAVDYGVQGEQRTRHASFFDYDNDGDLDLLLCNQPPNPGVYSEYYLTELLLDEYSPTLYENRDSVFVDVTRKAGLYKPGFPNSVTTSDLNADGLTDIWFANDYWAGDFIYMNNGDGTFTDRTEEMTRHITFSSMGIDAGDINNDGLLDVMVLDMEPEDHYRRNRNMGGMKAEAFWEVVDEGGHYQYFTNTLFLNQGDGFFSEISRLAGIGSTDWSWSNFFADLDNDGWKDIFIANGLMRDIRDNDAAVEFPRVVEALISEYLKKNPNPEGVSVWDIVNMEKAMMISPSVKLMNYAYRNNGDLSFTNVSEDWGFEQPTFSNGAAYADLDNDGDLDIVINNINDTASLYRNNSSEKGINHFIRIKPVADKEGVILMGTKVRIEYGDKLQFYEFTNVRGMYSSSEQIAHFGLGSYDKVDRLEVRWPDGRIFINKNVKADQLIEIMHSESELVNNDGQEPVDNNEQEPVDNNEQEPAKVLFKEVTAEHGLKYTHQENVFDDFSRQFLLPYKMSELGPDIATGDINGDGLDDFFIGGAAGRAGQLFLQQEDGNFSQANSEALQNDKIHEDMGAAFFDVDNDGDVDLYVVSGGNEFRPRASFYQDRLYLNDGSGNFTRTEEWLPPMNISGSKVYPEDIDQDGDIDLLLTGRHIPWSYPDPESSKILINSGNRFEDMTAEIAPGLSGLGMVNDACWVDFDRDGMKDLVIVGEWMPVMFFRNEMLTFRDVTEELGLADKKGWWFSVEAGDMDMDGDMDIVVGNYGLNSKYHGTKEEPFEVYYSDLDNNGLKDIVLVYTQDSVKYPYRRREDAMVQVPGIADRFKTYAAYAESDVFEIYGRENLERALHYEANTFESVYIENAGKGKFVVHTLPVEAQLSSINDILIRDYNGDNYPDLLVAGNLYATEVRTPRNDAGIGLLMTGNGKGDFKSWTYPQSGFFVPYDVKSLAEIQVKENKYVIVGCNNDDMKVFEVMR